MQHPDHSDHLSISQIQKFLLCPLAYKFKYVDRIETGVKSSGLVLGSAFHVAAEELHRDLIQGRTRRPAKYRELVVESLATEFGNFEIQTKDGETEESLRSDGIALIDLYHEYRSHEPARLVATEQRIERELVNVRTGEILDVPFVAFIDLLEESNEGIVVVDLKTAGKAYTRLAVDSDLQLSCYGLLMLLATGKKPCRLRIDALIKTSKPRVQRVETTRHEADYIRFWSIASGIRMAIRSGVFYPNPGWQCPTCEYATLCQRWGLGEEAE